MLRKPKPLLPGGRVVVLAISSPSKPDRIEVAKQHLEKSGVRVTLASNLYKNSRSYLAVSDDERREEINHYLRSDDVDAFFFARGGYGAMRILDRIDYNAVAAIPLPFIGFSDLTALHQACAVRARI